MLPTEVSVSKIRDAVEFDERGNTVKYQEYTFFIGDHGPFTEKFYAGEQFPAAIARRITDRVLALRELGILKAS